VLALVAGLSTGHKIGLAVVAAVFIVFALSVSFLAPRRWPEFPGRNGLSVFVIACFVLFFGMLGSVYAFGKEQPEGVKAAESHAGSPAKKTLQVTESEWKVQLPPTKELAEGTYTFVVKNGGKIPHDLVVQGPKIAGPTKTPLIKPGGTAKLTVSLSVGNYTLYCDVPGHRALGMQATLSVG
jgi:uncharacterized cupredoxin-like copper-binding protein